MAAERENGSGNGELARQAHADWGSGSQQHKQPLGPLHRRLGVVSGPRERAAVAQAERDLRLQQAAAHDQATRDQAGGYGRPAPSTVRIRGEFTADQAHWIINYLWDNRGAMWNAFPHPAPNGLYYLELRHFLWPRAGKVVYIHTRAEFMAMLTSHDYDDLPVRAVTPLPAGHRR